MTNIPVHIQYSDSNSYPDFFADKISQTFVEKSKVLEIGAGPSLHPSLQPIKSQIGELTGIDPMPEVKANTWLDHCIHGSFEKSSIPSNSFDHAFSFNVVEHLADPELFLSKLSTVLKPNGTFWALTPNARHPFCRISRGIEVINLKGAYRRWLARDSENFSVNDYPAYYRLNDPFRIQKMVDRLQLPFASIDAYYLDAGWEGYFAPSMKWMPNAIDKLFSFFPRNQLILIWKLTRTSS